MKLVEGGKVICEQKRTRGDVNKTKWDFLTLFNQNFEMFATWYNHHFTSDFLNATSKKVFKR